MTSGRTNDVTSIRGSPEAASMSMSRTLSSVGMTSGSFWNPSRGPTSRMRTLCGSPFTPQSYALTLARLDGADVDHAAFVRADADRPLALANLDLEAELPSVGDFLELRARNACRSIGRGGHVLDADLEADGRLALRKVLVGEERRVPLHHRDQPRRRDHAHADRAAPVRHEPILDDELRGPLEARLDRRLGRAIRVGDDLVERTGAPAHTIPN